MILIGFCGFAGAGKSTAAQRLIGRHGFQRHRFAGPLKDMLKTLGLTDAQVDGSLKETPCPLLGGKTPRWAMQALGTEWGRDCIDEGIWIRAWANRAEACDLVVVDDVRFPNEVDAIKKRGGHVVRIVGRGQTPGEGAHVSELHPLDFDEEIENSGDVHTLNAEIDALANRIKALASVFS